MGPAPGLRRGSPVPPLVPGTSGSKACPGLSAAGRPRITGQNTPASLARAQVSEGGSGLPSLPVGRGAGSTLVLGARGRGHSAPDPGDPGDPGPSALHRSPLDAVRIGGAPGRLGPDRGRAGTSTAGARPRPNVPPRRGVGVPANCSPIAAPAAGAARQSGRPGPAPLARLPSAGFALQSGSRGRLPKHEEDTCCGPGHLEGEATSRGGAVRRLSSPRFALMWRSHPRGHPWGHPRQHRAIGWSPVRPWEARRV